MGWALGNKLLDLVRAGVMPAVTIGGFGALVYMVLTGQSEQIPDWFQVLVAGTVGWWFASAKNGMDHPPGP